LQLRSPADASQSPDCWAKLAATAIDSNDRGSAAAARRDNESALLVMHRLSDLASKFRRHGEPEKAERITLRMLALANHFTTAYPGEPATYLALSQAYIQRSKESWQAHDRPGVAANMKQAYDAAELALLLEPKSETAQQAVWGLRQKLAGYLCADLGPRVASCPRAAAKTGRILISSHD
jgi:hypothetical protein